MATVCVLMAVKIHISTLNQRTVASSHRPVAVASMPRANDASGISGYPRHS